MPPTLYMIPASPPVRAVLMLAKSISLELNLLPINPQKSEHKTPEFLKLNPQHTVPTLVDEDGTIVWDSHAIMPYLISKYAESNELYPTDPKKHAIIDQRLHFDSGVLFPLLARILRPIIYKGKKLIEQEDRDSLHEVYAFLEAFLEGRQWIAGDSITIADFSIISSLTSANVLEKITQKYPRLSSYLKRAEAEPEFEENKSGLGDFEGLITSLLQ